MSKIRIESMSLIGKMEIGRPVGQKALKAVPDMILEIEDIRSLADEPFKFIFWASNDDFQTYESALTDDPSVSDYKCLTELPERRLYQIQLSEEGQQNTLQPIAVEQDIVPISLTMTVEGVEFVGRFPSRSAIITLKEKCEELDRHFRLINLYEEKPVEKDGGRTNRYGVTSSQRGALIAALEKGYFNVPRETRMEDIADELDISTSALSAQLRRGQKALLRHTLANGSSI